MKIIIFGATGNIGKRITTEAISRNHKVTAVVRNKTTTDNFSDLVNITIGDASILDQVLNLSKEADVLVAATRPPEGEENQLVETTRVLLEAAKQSGVRLIISGGAASLTIPDTQEKRVMDDCRYLSEQFLPIARACDDQYKLCLDNPNVQWTYLSPPALIRPGKRSGRYRLGKDELLVDENGVSEISMEDLAVALLDEIEHPQHIRQRFTVAY